VFAQVFDTDLGLLFLHRYDFFFILPNPKHYDFSGQKPFTHMVLEM
jgi:hypothetical protein